MPTIRLAACGAMILLLLHVLPAAVFSAKPVAGVYSATTDNSGLVAAPVMYGDSMYLAVTDDGVAAIVFAKKDASLVNKSAKYQFRYLKDADSEEILGTGIVLDTVNDKEKLTIKAGPIRIGWSGSSHDRGWILYNPEEMLISIADAGRFADSVMDIPGQTVPLEKLDLKRFLKRQN